MKNSLAVVVVAALISGCSTTSKPVVKENAEAAKASKTYLESMHLRPGSEKHSSVACLVPAEAQKPAPGVVTGPSKDWRKLVQHASACAREKNWKTLETLATGIARLDVDSPWGAYFLSIAAEGAGEIQRALWMADLAQKKAGGRSGLFAYQKGRLFYRLNETVRAMKEIELAVEMDASLAEGHLFLADVYRRDMETDRAQKAYSAVLAADPGNYKALTTLAEIKLEASAHAEAAELYVNAVGAHPEQLQAWLRLAYIYETVQKNGGQALSTYKNLKQSIETGSVRERPDFDLNAKIKTLEQTLPRVPAQAKIDANEPKKSVK